MINIRKYHGAGNDFILIERETAKELEENFVVFVQKICHRRYGIGADGLMFPGKSQVADFFMHYYNSDGSLAEMCGNGLRCFSKFVFEMGMIKRKTFTVETLSGIMSVELQEHGVKINMGKAILDVEKIPVKTEKSHFLEEEIFVIDRNFTVSSANVGVPHTMVLVDCLSTELVVKYGSALECSELFPEKSNINFVKWRNSKEIEIDTWERGAGNTLACGTGSCASVYLLYVLGKVGKYVKVYAQGGILEVTIGEEDTLYLEGEACFIMKGEYLYEKNNE